MARIKSALEIALERTGNVKGDRSSVEQFEHRQEGKKIANAFLSDPAGESLEARLKKVPEKLRNAARRGAFEVLLSQVALPAQKADLERLSAVGKGLAAAVGDRRFAATFQQLEQALARFLDESDQYDQAIRRQFEPKLRRKEEDLARRTGRQVRIDPLQDPEFVAFYNQNMGALKDKYQAAVDQVRAMAEEAFGSDIA